MSLGQAYKCIQ